MAADDRTDLGALFARLTRRMMEAETPLLERHGLTMWQYVVLTRLASGTAPTQLQLARDISYDKTRLITLLDALAAEGLVERTPDPGDRRARIVSITPAGAKRHAALVADIRAMEDSLLAVLPAGERRALLSALPKLLASSADVAGGA